MKLVRFSIDHPRFIIAITITITIILALGAALPTISPKKFFFLKPLRVDTDPENMLSKDEAVRIFHDKMKKIMSIHDMIVLGVVNEKDPDGVFNPSSLAKIYKLTNYIKKIKWEDPKNPEKRVGVIDVDLIAPSTVDNIEQGGLGVVKFEWLMPYPPKTRKEAISIREKANRIPFLKGTLVSSDGKAICLYIPITSKDISYKVYSKILKKISELKGDERYFITGLPVAEDTFGVEMFQQMATSAPVAALIIFMLLFYFFKNLILVISPMIVAMISAICTMSLLVISGKTVHIMSSMIPIFIIPISVLDSIHILSEFFDRYQETKDKRKTIMNIMEDLFSPMLYTSLTTAAGFSSLALTPIPPVQVFGIFVAIGVMFAWVLTVTFIPAFSVLISDKSLENFGASPQKDIPSSPLSKLLFKMGNTTYKRANTILVLTGFITIFAIYGIKKIRINDNPIKWFSKSHPIRIADTVLNRHFGGTYMAYLTLESKNPYISTKDYLKDLEKRLKKEAQTIKDEMPYAYSAFIKLSEKAKSLAEISSSPDDLIKRLGAFCEEKKRSSSKEAFFGWDEASLFLAKETQRGEVFKNPKALRYIEDLQKHLMNTEVVGKSNSLADIVKTVYRELLLGDPKNFRIPDTKAAVAQCLITYQNSHRPQDLWHFVTPNYKRSVIWVQMKSGDNIDMSKVVTFVDNYMKKNPPPFPTKHRWFGLTYINVIWQKKMVKGMLEAFLGSFLIVLLMMIVLFRSAVWGILCMIPLTVTIGLIYGVIGIIGKDYDMPVAVLSSLSLGLAVDYAIHFLSRSRNFYERFGSWEKASGPVFGEPARAISRNAIVVSIGFLPLILSHLVPYKTVGILIASILFAAGITSLLILPSMITVLEKWLFAKEAKRIFMCNCATCVVSAIAAIALLAINLYQFFHVGFTKLTWISAIAIIFLLTICCIFSKTKICKI